ncbi:DUF167 family protein YggU [Rheinheimera sp. MMS21-TC3]|uniref:DUF167 family protein YggU n=1 Tax=Rheinheimera sp. MMS21-TC3 TaxID=3072790 RepID=UPI0028C408A7|nr:DUF167 family protein YggU [Rheinheimera sp. MMS21-TC3]WNO61387.1 DUF167 family protein YggU [Rheinheimera sp. MMS21-TC3]
MPIQQIQNGLRLRLYLQPKSSRDQWVGLYNDAIKIAITAPPIDGKANQHLLKFLAKSFKVAKSDIVLEKGELSRHKMVVILSPKVLPPLIESLLSTR